MHFAFPDTMSPRRRACPPHAVQLIRLMRHWAAARAAGADPLPALVRRSAEGGDDGSVAIALDSLLALTEACLKRQLVTGCCCAPRLTPDENAVLVLIETAPDVLVNRARQPLPGVLPGVLAWAAQAVRRHLGWPHAAV